MDVNAIVVEHDVSNIRHLVSIAWDRIVYGFIVFDSLEVMMTASSSGSDDDMDLELDWSWS